MHADQIAAFLAEPTRMAQVAAVSPTGNPLLGSLWFTFEDAHFWFSSHPTSPLVVAAEQSLPIAVIIDDFTPPDAIRQVRIRGEGLVENHDPDRVGRIYERYLGADRSTWPDFFQERVADDSWSLWTVRPDSGVATINPGFRPLEVRWSDVDDSPLGQAGRPH